MKKMLIAGNWKMNTNVDESIELAQTIVNGLKIKGGVKSDILICPPFTSLHGVSKIIEGTPVYLGAQNCYFKDKGAFTGEISPKMLLHLHCKYVIIGHSERRQYFYEDDWLINKKISFVLKSGLKPIFCIGETLDERQANKTLSVLKRQILTGLDSIDEFELSNVVIAYEPVWAIGTGISATLEQIAEAHDWIRSIMKDSFGNEFQYNLILYGGSLNAENGEEILRLKDVNGGLIGGASLNAASFLTLVNYSESIL